MKSVGWMIRGMALAVAMVAAAGWSAAACADDRLSHAELQPVSLDLVKQLPDGSLQLADVAFSSNDEGVIVLPVDEDDRVMESVIRDDDLATLSQVSATRGEFFFQLERGGDYHVALVAAFPWHGTWTINYQWDGGVSRTAICAVEPEQSESLHVLPVEDMRTRFGAGTHRLSVSIPGSGRIVAVVLQRDEAFAVRAVESAPSVNAFKPGGGTVRFAPVQPLGVDEILGVESPGAQGRIEWAALDQAGLAKPVSEIGDLVESGEPLVLRAVFHRDEKGVGAVLPSAAVAYRVDPEKVLHLGNDDVLVEVDRVTGRMGRVVHQASGRAVRRQAELPFRLLQWSDSDEALVAIAPERFVCEQVVSDGDSATMTYVDSGVSEGERRVTFTMKLDGPQVLCTMSVDNQAADRVRLVQFPYMSYVSASQDPRQDRVAWAGRYLGDVVSTPAHVKGYHTPMLMYAVVFGEEAGFYLAAHDATGEADRMVMEPATGEPPYHYTIEANHTIEPGDTWSSQTHVIAVHEGDWHVGADMYRAWYETIPRHAQDPEWLRSDYVTSLNAHMTWGDSFATLVDDWKQTRWRGTFAMKVNGIGGDGFTNNFHPYPSPMNGGPKMLRKATEWINERGGQMDAYLNVRSYTPSWDDGTMIGWTPRWRLPLDEPMVMPGEAWTKANAQVQLDGTHRVTGGPHRPFQPVYNMSHRSKGWHEYWMHWLPYYAKLGLDVYWDLAMVSTFRDDLPVERRQWPDLNYQQGLMRTAKEAIDEARKFKPDFMVRGEGVNDRMMRYLHLSFMYTHSKHTPMYRYTLPDQVLDYVVFNGDYERYQAHWENGMLFHMRVLGGQGWGKGWGTDMRRVTYLRKTTMDVSLVGRYMDNVGLAGETDRQLARYVVLDEADRKAVAINTVNRAEAQGWELALDWPLDEAPRWAFAYTMGNQVRKVPFTFEGGVLRFTAPAERVGTLVFIAKETPERQLRVDAFTPMNVPGRDLVRVTLANASDRVVSGDVRIPLFEGVRAEQEAYPVQLGAGEATVLEIPIEGVSALQDFIELPLVVSTDGSSERTVLVQVAPLLPNGQIGLDELGDASPDHWHRGVRFRNRDGEGYHLAISAHPNFQLASYVEAPIHLRPSTRYRLTIRSKGNAELLASVVMRDQHKRGLDTARLRLPESVEWRESSTEFVTTELTDAGWSVLQLRCNSDGWRDGGWVDEVRVEMLGPAE